MSIYALDESMLYNLAGEIEALPPRPHHSALLEAANCIRPGCAFRYALNRGGWYRPGGIIRPDGGRVADSLETWAKAELQICGGDMHELVERYAGSGLLVTRHIGRTHYFVAACGPAPADFLQLEVEELQEVLDRQLVDAGKPPEDLQELTEPILPETLEAQAVAAPRYRFRRLIDMRQTVARAAASDARNAGLSRLLSEWTHSSAAARGHFSDHWIVALREHQDRYRNPVVSASLVSRHARELKPFQWNPDLAGVEMCAQLQAFDRAAGYASAWYAHLVAGTIAPPKVAYAVARDLDAGFSYLPDTEAVLIRNWVAAPYSV
ncbi:hypothetical protein MIZ01_0842 [Sideroxyarcus emersonii]|uniref:Uncharacterized protein n=1 Tax=Sideroxyarcus emersonii TaxID=2764705 RepID=A0AAN1X8W1_9PROT|nr:hypothetical protein [Sideroxyarcus emersonii]BCK87072.1 hypothetical protein MIZ01_0842 [Sideroxyarcus emersonii]